MAGEDSLPDLKHRSGQTRQIELTVVRVARARNWRATYWCARRSFPLVEGREPIFPERRTAAWYGLGASEVAGEAVRSAVTASAAIEVASTRDV
jgi:hypothetical protein